jgi:hypothetical protein
MPGSRVRTIWLHASGAALAGYESNLAYAVTSSRFLEQTFYKHGSRGLRVSRHVSLSEATITNGE